jgi:hypothetical protein
VRGDADGSLTQGTVRYVDTTLGKAIVYDAAANVWRDAATGASA